MTTVIAYAIVTEDVMRKPENREWINRLLVYALRMKSPNVVTAGGTEMECLGCVEGDERYEVPHRHVTMTGVVDA